MKPIKFFIMLGAIFYFTTGIASAVVLGQCVREDTKVLYSNGVLGVYEDAYDIAIDIGTLVNKNLKIDGINLDFMAANNASVYEYQTLNVGDCDALNFGVQFNPSHGKTKDIFEATIQSFNEDTSVWWRVFFGSILMPESFKDKIVELSTSFEESYSLDQQNINAHITNHTNFLDTYGAVNYPDANIISISHSQGNYYSNIIKESLILKVKSRYHIMAIASPSSSISGVFDHTTNHLDLVIQGIRWAKINVFLQPEPLPANTVGFTFNDISGHFFKQSYLNPGSDSENKIIRSASDSIPTVDYHSAPEEEPYPCSGDLIWTGFSCEYD